MDNTPPGALVGWAHKPTVWVVAEKILSIFHYWTQVAYCVEHLGVLNSQQNYFFFRPPDARVSFPDIRQLALLVFRQG